uniref:Uncharacterized protein n=1 Tax=viral metagenome TaxID=1070528 RepID=A0A6M3JMR9_9ZZZZ
MRNLFDFNVRPLERLVGYIARKTAHQVRCNHRTVRFLGVQPTIDGGHFKLYNCRDCHTTLGEQDIREMQTFLKHTGVIE